MLSIILGVSPLVGNLLATVLTFIYVFGLVALMNVCVTRFGLPQDISRKITHIGAGSIIVFCHFITTHIGQNT